jgi:ketosteroid isomerase-like protein
MGDEKTIRDREAALYAAMLAFDYPALDRILSDEVQYVHSTGVVEGKTAFFSGMRQGLYEYGDITIAGAETKSFPGVAITTGVMTMVVGEKGSAKGTIRLQHVLVWRQEGTEWRLLLRQATRLPG